MQQPKLIVGLDFETYFDAKYSLRSQTISLSEYVRDARFKAQCVGIRTNRQKKAKWYKHEDIPKALAQFDWRECGLLAHNTAFDGLILSHHYGHVPAYYYDSMSMARPLFNHAIGAGLEEVTRHLRLKGKLGGGKALDATKGVRDLPPELMKSLGLYCAQDVDIMWDAFNIMRKDFPDKEMDLVHLSINAFCNPVLDVDVPRATKERERAEKESKRTILKASKVFDLGQLRGAPRLAQLTKLLRSREQFADALRSQGVNPPMKISKDTGKPTYAFAKDDLDFQALGGHPEKAVRDLYAAKLEANSSIAVTRAVRLIQRVENGNKLPIMLHYAKAHTLRWTGGDKLNPQNFPARGKNGNELRRSILAPKGQRIVVVDSSQIEGRGVAWIAGQKDLLEVFRLSDQKKGPDPYCVLATEIYKRPITKKDAQQRFVGKVGQLGLGFNMGADKYQYTLAAGTMGPPVQIDLELARLVVQVFRRKNWRIANFWKYMQRALSLMLAGREETLTIDGHDILHFHPEGVDLPNGLTLWYPKLKAKYNPRFERMDDFEYWNGKHYTKIYGGLFTENVVQALARCAVAEQMLEIAERYRVVLMSHDEVGFLAPAKEADKALEFGIACLRKAPLWCQGLPFNAEGGHDVCYSK